MGGRAGRFFRRHGRGMLALALAGAVGAALFVGAGAYNVAASTGHWRVTEALLRLGLWRSVAVRAPDEAPVSLADPDLVRLGAGAFLQGCAVCHGAPGRPPNPVVLGMMPPPPVLHHDALSWSDGELGFIVEHGIKYTGMPAWPDGRRGDEVWSVVAFLRALPRLDAPAMSAMLAADPRSLDPTGMDPKAGCVACHGGGAVAPRSTLVPRLNGQKRAFLEAALAAYANGHRASGIMRLASAPLSPDDRADLARFYAELAPLPPGSEDPVRAGAGRVLAEQGDPSRRIPACLTCHGPEGRADYPRLDGQSARYLAQRLRLWQGAKDSPNATATDAVMAPIARRLDPEEIEPLAAFFAARAPLQVRP